MELLSYRNIYRPTFQIYLRNHRARLMCSAMLRCGWLLNFCHKVCAEQTLWGVLQIMSLRDQGVADIILGHCPPTQLNLYGSYMVFLIPTWLNYLQVMFTRLRVQIEFERNVG